MSAIWQIPSAGRPSLERQEILCPPSPTQIGWPLQRFSARESAVAPPETSVRTIKAWSDRALDLVRISNFADDWDGLGADEPDRAVIRRANVFFQVLKEELPNSPPMRILLSADSSIAFEWVAGDNFVQAEITDAKEIEWMFATPGKETQFITEILDDPSTTGSEQGQAWQPAPAVAEEPDYASAH